MRKGDKLKIKGSLGFLWNPVMVILDIRDGSVLLEPDGISKDGILSELNQSWHEISLIEEKL